MGAIIIVSSLVILAGFVLQTVFMFAEKKEKYVKAMIFKGLASVMFVVLGLLSTQFDFYTRFSVLIFIGLCLGALGDILLALRFVIKKLESKIFIIGTLSFLAGHVLYLIALIPHGGNPVYPILSALVITAVIVYFIFTKLKVPALHKIVGLIYVLSVSLMASFAVSMCIADYSPATLKIAVGGVFFLASDTVMIFNSFSPNPKFYLRVANLSLYYVAQVLIALSVLTF